MHDLALFNDCRYGSIICLLVAQQQVAVVFYICFSLRLTTNVSCDIKCSNKLILHNAGVHFHVMAIKFLALPYHNDISNKN